MTQKTLADAFYETLKDVFYAEKQSVRTLKKSIKLAESQELRNALSQHAEESSNQIDRLTQIFASIDKSARGKTCEVMQGLCAEMEEDMEDFGGSEASDAVLTGCARAIEHYEIARYSLLQSWARQLGYTEAENLLGQTLEEEKRADKILTQLGDALISDQKRSATNKESTKGSSASAPSKGKVPA